MTAQNWLSEMGVGTKQLSERYAEYAAPVHDQQLYYPYEPSLPSHEHVPVSKHHYNGGGHKSNAAMSALTLLAFLFFLHILQQCLKEHMTAMSTPQVMVVSAGREGEQNIAKISNKNKLDKTGVATEDMPSTEAALVKIKNKINDIDNMPVPNHDNEEYLMKIQTAEHTPRRIQKY